MGRKISAFFSKKSLSTQMIFIIGVVIAVIAVIMFVISHFFTANYNSMLNSQLSTILEVYSDEVQSTVTGIEDDTISFMTEDSVQRSIKEYGKRDRYQYEDYVAVNELKKQLLSVVNGKQSIKYAVLMDNSYKSIVTALGYNMVWNNDMADEVRSQMGSDMIVKCRWLPPSERIKDLTVVRRIIDISDPGLPQIALLVVGVEMSELVKVGNSRLDGYKFNSIIMSGSDVIYSTFGSADETEKLMERIIRGRAMVHYMGKAYYSSYKEMDMPDWKYAVYVPRSEIMGGLDKVIIIGYVMLILFICAVFVISYRMSKRIVRPLSDLSQQMKKVETGVFEGMEPDREGGSLEINSIADDFNVMVRHIAALIEENYLKKILLQESELKLLQSQINPHFLYNTLESINWMSKTGRTREISTMVQALSRLFRSTVNNKDFMITIRGELELLDNYITIQKLRFEDTLEIYVDIDEDCYDCMIPKLVLQPLVENAIKYARESSADVCVISIYSEIRDGRLRICVEDNGPGIDAETIQKILSGEKIESGGTGIALGNIRRRMELAYRTENGMAIESRGGGGTTIALLLPLEDKKKEKTE